MGLFKILRGKKDENENENSQAKHQNLEQMQQTRRCNNCGGHLMGNRIKGSQMICTNCGNRVYLY